MLVTVSGFCLPAHSCSVACSHQVMPNVVNNTLKAHYMLTPQDRHCAHHTVAAAEGITAVWNSTNTTAKAATNSGAAIGLLPQRQLLSFA